jgi:ribonuclease R
LEEESTGSFKFVPTHSIVTGRVQLIGSGSAFVISDESEEDIYIPRKFMNGALNDDTVEVCIWARRKKRSPEGEITKIIKRNKTKFSGIVSITNDNIAFLIVTEKNMPYDIFIPTKELNGAIHGKKAVAEITRWAENQKNPSGKIIDVLGDEGDNDAEMHSILTEFNLPYKFPERLTKLAEQIPDQILRSRLILMMQRILMMHFHSDDLKTGIMKLVYTSQMLLITSKTGMKLTKKASKGPHPFIWLTGQSLCYPRNCRIISVLYVPKRIN